MLLKKHCKMRQSIRDAEKLVPNPPKDALPTRLTRSGDEAAIDTFNYVYRQVVALLEHAENKTDSEVSTDIAIFRAVLKEYKLESNKAAGLAVANLNLELSEKIRDGRLETKVNWNKEDEVIDALKSWKID